MCSLQCVSGTCCPGLSCIPLAPGSLLGQCRITQDSSVTAVTFRMFTIYLNVIPATKPVQWTRGLKVLSEQFHELLVAYYLCSLNWAPRHEGVLGSGGIAPRIIDLGTRLRWVLSFTPRSFYPQGRRPWYPLDRRLGGPQSRSGRGGKEENSQPPPGTEH
jgi:hypothetical protein